MHLFLLGSSALDPVLFVSVIGMERGYGKRANDHRGNSPAAYPLYRYTGERNRTPLERRRCRHLKQWERRKRLTRNRKRPPCESLEISDLLPLSDYTFASHDVGWSYTSFELIDQKVGTLPRDKNRKQTLNTESISAVVGGLGEEMI